jgi:hypothetical protein
MDREVFNPRPPLREWESPAAEEIRVSAEATAYSGVSPWDEW